MSRYPSDDIDLLLPSFAAKVRRLLDAMRARGFDPVPFDTLRTPKEAAKFAAKGVGSANSMHLYGAACDVICGVHGWGCHERSCMFFGALGSEVEALGLTWGGRFKTRFDQPHFQACTVEQQPSVRAIADWHERDRYVATLMRR
jgi:hypothetical protein